MATRLSPLGIIAKWFLVPGILAATGYFIIGPRVGDKVIPKDIKDRLPTVAGNPASQSAQNESGQQGSTPKTFAAPEVDVSVTPVKTQPKRKRHRRKKKPSVTAPPVDNGAPAAPATPPDTGGGTDGGATPPPVGHDG